MHALLWGKIQAGAPACRGCEFVGWVGIHVGHLWYDTNKQCVSGWYHLTFEQQWPPWRKSRRISISNLFRVILRWWNWKVILSIAILPATLLSRKISYFCPAHEEWLEFQKAQWPHDITTATKQKCQPPTTTTASWHKGTAKLCEWVGLGCLKKSMFLFLFADSLM